MRRRHFKYLKVHVTVYQVENANVSTSLNAHDLPFPQKSTSWGRQPPVDWYRALWWPSNDLDTSWCHKAELNDGNWHKSHQMRWHDSSHALLPFALPPPQEPATTQCWISTETYPVREQARFRLFAHYACILAEFSQKIITFSGKNWKWREKTSMYCIHVFVSVETNEKASLQWRALLGKLYFRELLGGGQWAF